MKKATHFLTRLGLMATLLQAGQAAALDLPKPAPMPFVQKEFKAVSARSERIWQQHLQSLAKEPLQSACQPFRLQARGQRRGSIVLVHGFTACPQQFWEIAPKLTNEGYDVFAPLLPGHGRAYGLKDGKIIDDLSTMPSNEGYRLYQDFALALADLVRDEPGSRQISGLSLGGVVTATALVQSPEVFDRALLMTPQFDIARPNNLYLPVLNTVLSSSRGDWGPSCEEERAGGRGGYCQFSLGNVRAAQMVGQEALARMDSVTATVQVVGVEGDKAIANEALALAAARLPFKSACLYAGGANHSMVSRYDAPRENKFWMSSLHRQLMRFITSDTFFDAVQPAYEADLPRCDNS